MRKLLLLLVTSCIYAQTPRPKILLRSGFESGVTIDTEFVNGHKLMGVDQSYLPPNDWNGNYADTDQWGGMLLWFDPGTSADRFAELTTDPEDPNNTVMLFRSNNPFVFPNNAPHYQGRVQSNIHTVENPLTEFSYSLRMYFPTTLSPLKDQLLDIPNDDWFMIGELWNHRNWIGMPYPFRISLLLKKDANSLLQFKVDATEMRHIPSTDCVNNYEPNCMDGFYRLWQAPMPNESAMEVPLGKWLTIQIYYKQGKWPNELGPGETPGRFQMIVTPDGEAPVVVCDVTKRTQHSQDTSPGGVDILQPLKLYVTGETVDYVNNHGGITQVYYDDLVYCDKPEVDLQIRDTPEDLGIEPNTVSPYFWGSNDIWVRNANDDGLEHQNPEYNPNQPNYVRVRVNNKSCKASTEGSILKVYWAKAGTALTWPDSWDGSTFLGTALMGKPIGEIPIPPLAAGKDIILTLPFNVPDRAIYEGITAEPWHFCLLARIDSTEDPMSYDEIGLSVIDNARNNNNIGWKNITIVDIISDAAAPIGASVSVRNPGNEINPYDIVFTADTFDPGNAIFEEAEVNVTIDDLLLHAWVDGGKILTNLKPTRDPHRFIVTGNHAKLENLKLPAGTTGMLNLSFNFLTQKISEKQEFTYHVIQNDKRLDGRVIGGETYVIRKSSKPLFTADAGADREARKHEKIILKAREISNLAIYNWYDIDGNLIYVGKDLTVNPEVTKKYKLEVIDIDGYKDYDEIEVKISQFKFGAITPNPASSWINVTFETSGVISAYLMVVNINSGVSYNYILDPALNQKNINIDSYENGLYRMLLICDGVVVDENTLVKN